MVLLQNVPTPLQLPRIDSFHKHVICTWDMTDSYLLHHRCVAGLSSCARCVDMTHSYVQHVSSSRALCHTYEWKTHVYIQIASTHTVTRAAFNGVSKPLNHTCKPFNHTSHTTHVAFTCAVWLIRMWDMKDSHVLHTCVSESFPCAQCVDLTHSYVRHDSSIPRKDGPHESYALFTRVMWLIHTWNVSFICVTWLIHMGNIGHRYVWHDALICVTWLMLMCDMTHSYLPRMAPISCMRLSYVWCDSFICVTWLIHMSDMGQPFVWHDSFTCVTWLMHTCDMTHSYVRHDSFTPPTVGPHRPPPDK